ncbi:MAG: DUF4878 domain-containing protein [Actinobacteria bacterium]|nr:DUF4878 domain-containing protein [Actinomycetota bacterium]
MRKVCVLLVASFLAIALLAISGCGDEGSSESPREVADKYLKASVALDVDAAYDLLSQVDQDNLSKEQMQAEAEQMEGIDFSYELGEEKISGDEATVEVTLIVEDVESGESERLDDTLNLIKENGEWKIYLGDSL